MHVKGCSVVCSNNNQFEPKRLMCLCSYYHEEPCPEDLRHKVLKEVGLKSTLRIELDICVMEEKKKSFIFDWDSRLDWCYPAITDISNYLKYQSRQPNKTSERSRHVCARKKYLVCNSLSLGKRGLCKLWWWNLLGCDCLWLNSQKDKLVLSSIPQNCILLCACACMFSHTLQAHYIPPSPLK